MWDSETYGEKPFPRTFDLVTGLASMQGYQYKSRTRWSEEFYEMSNWADGWTRGGWVSKDQRPREARQVYRIANKAKRRLSKLNKRIDRTREQKDLSRADKERRIIELYMQRTDIYKKAVPRMRDYYHRWKYKN